ncbi:MAG TPA: PaaI family thioesterase [Rhizomicrobium sp.]|jgi:uncharacterized protein (TIGR00369 family)|nr:PaaI family thioesterase [Rhizomicrobium sp.]
MRAPQGFSETELVDPFELFVGPVFDRTSGEGRRFVFRVDERHVNMRGVLHGGMLMTFADLSLGAAVWDATDHAPCVTLNMQTHFLKPGHAGDLVEVLPQLTRRTRSLVFMRGDFTVGGEILMTASSIWKLLGQD